MKNRYNVCESVLRWINGERVDQGTKILLDSKLKRIAGMQVVSHCRDTQCDFLNEEANYTVEVFYKLKKRP